MKVLKSWLENWVNLSSVKTAEIINIFESLGYEIENVTRLKPDYKNIVVGEVTEIINLPKAEKIRLTKVNIGDELLEIICGARNFNEGDLVAVAKPGSYIAESFKIEKKVIMGYESNGMICSPSELNLWDQQDGILVISETNLSKGALLESCYESYDTMIELSVTPNRGDSMSHFGLAREIATKLSMPIKHASYSYSNDIQSTIKLSNGINSGSRSYFGLEIENILITESSLDIRFKLASLGVRPINNLVDATNYVLFDLGQPLHAFDRDKLCGPVSVRKSKKNESIKTLDGLVRKLSKEDIVITDNDRPVALAGVMGGYDTQITEDTKNILVESANFETVNILKTSRSLNMISEASIRFERGVDNLVQENALSALRKYILKSTENALFSQITGERESPKPKKIVNFSKDYYLQIIGVEISDKDTERILNGLGFDHEINHNDSYDITVPSWRYDIDRDIDIVEELARHQDFDSFPSTISYGNNFNIGSEWNNINKIGNYLSSSGFYECFNLSFISEADSKIFTPERNLVSVSNPLDETQKNLRTTSTTHLLKNIVNNLNLGNEVHPIYEVGVSFNNIPNKLDKNIPEQVNYISIVIPEKIYSKDRRCIEKVTDIHYMASIIRGLSKAEISYEKVSRPGLHSEQSFTVFSNGINIGWFGKLSEISKEYFGLKVDSFLGEINLDKLFILDETQDIFHNISSFPHIKFDLSFEIKNNLKAGEILTYIFNNYSEYENSSYIFDEYFVPDTKIRTIGIRIILRSYLKTISDKELTEIRKKLIQDITVTFSAILKDYE